MTSSLVIFVSILFLESLCADNPKGGPGGRGEIQSLQIQSTNVSSLINITGLGKRVVPMLRDISAWLLLNKTGPLFWPIAVQGTSKRPFPGCENASGKLRQKW